MRRFFVPVVAVVLGCAVAVPAAGATASVGAAPFCGLRWGSLAEQDDRHTSANITNLRAGRHDCFDRLVVDLGPKVAGLSGPDASGYSVRYVSQLIDDPSGRPVTLAGGARLEVVVRARALTDDFVPTYSPADPARAVNVAGFRTLRQVAFVGTHEAQTQIGLGVRARLPFRVFLLAGPGNGSRLVVDVAHRW